MLRAHGSRLIKKKPTLLNIKRGRKFGFLAWLPSLLGFRLAWLGFGLLGSELCRKLRFKLNHKSIESRSSIGRSGFLLGSTERLFSIDNYPIARILNFSCNASSSWPNFVSRRLVGFALAFPLACCCSIMMICNASPIVPSMRVLRAQRAHRLPSGLCAQKITGC